MTARDAGIAHWTRWDFSALNPGARNACSMARAVGVETGGARCGLESGAAFMSYRTSVCAQSAGTKPSTVHRSRRGTGRCTASPPGSPSSWEWITTEEVDDSGDPQIFLDTGLLVKGGADDFASKVKNPVDKRPIWGNSSTIIPMELRVH